MDTAQGSGGRPAPPDEGGGVGRASSTDGARSDRAHAHAILDAALDAIITIDHDGRVLEFNLAAEHTFGYAREQVIGRELAALIVPAEYREAHRTALTRWSAEGPGSGAGGLLGKRIEVRAMRADGSEFPAEIAITRVDVPGPPVFTACMRDISERREAEERLRATEQRYRSLVEQLPLAVYVDRVDDASSNLYASPQIESIVGYTAAEWLADPLLFVKLLHPDDRDAVLEVHHQTHATGAALNVEYRLIARDGRTVWVHDEARTFTDPVTGERVLQGYMLDVTARRHAEDMLRHQAFHDPLTGLANRALFTDRVEHALLRQEREAGAAVLFLDVDDFKGVNDTLGHLVGDALLQAVGLRLVDTLAPTHTVARIGGDEFAVLIEDADVALAIDAAERLIESLRHPFEIDGRELFATASIGVAVGDDAADLLRSADVAMYRAKSSGKAQYVIYASLMEVDVVGRLELVADLRRAALDEFVLEYQPTVDLTTGAVIGFEALVRWLHPTRGLLGPASFVQVAEETGRIVEIGRWVLAQACAQAAAWRSRLPGAAALTISVNASARQIHRPGLAEDVAAALAASCLDPSALVVEITESALAVERDEMLGILEEIAGTGVKIALDDFGTGYSSLSLLQDMPVHVLKVDRSFVHSLDAGPDRVAFLRAIVDLAAALRLSVIAEGVETARQAMAVRELGCGFAQGFHFARPLTAAQVEALVRSRAWPRLRQGPLPGSRAEAA